MTVFTVDPRQKKIVDLYGRPIGLPINDFGSRTEIEFSGFTYSSSLSIALYLIRPDFRDGQTMPVYYGTAWTESNGVYKHEMKYGKDYYNSVTQNDSLARLVLVADSVVVLDQEVQIDMIHSYSEDAERLPVGPDGYATEAYVDAAVSGKVDESELENYQKLITDEAKLDYSLVSGAPTIPLSTSQLTNDSDFITSSDVKDSTITLTQGGVTKGSFTLNQPSGATIDFDAGGGGSSTPTFVTPINDKEYIPFDTNVTVSSNYVISSNVSSTNVKWNTTDTGYQAGRHVEEYNIILEVPSTYVGDGLSFTDKDSIILYGNITPLVLIYPTTKYEKLVFTLYLNESPIRQGVYYVTNDYIGNTGTSSSDRLWQELDIPIEQNKSYVIHTGDTLRLNVKDAFSFSSYRLVFASSFNIGLDFLRLFLGNIKTNYDMRTNYANQFKYKVDSFIDEKTAGVYRLSNDTTYYSGSDSCSISENTFAVNDESYELSDGCSIYLAENSAFVFKTDSSFSSYSVSFYNAKYINSTINLEASKCYIISYLNGVVLWSELQEYSSN